jgi:hypothetical protein
VALAPSLMTHFHRASNLLPITHRVDTDRGSGIGAPYCQPRTGAASGLSPTDTDGVLAPHRCICLIPSTVQIRMAFCLPTGSQIWAVAKLGWPAVSGQYAIRRFSPRRQGQANRRCRSRRAAPPSEPAATSQNGSGRALCYPLCPWRKSWSPQAQGWRQTRVTMALPISDVVLPTLTSSETGSCRTAIRILETTTCVVVRPWRRVRLARTTRVGQGFSVGTRPP